MSKYNELVKKLKEIFQIDRPELEFGIYRILNARADEINDYLDNKLKAKIKTALADAGNANKADLEQQLQAAIKATTDAGFEPDQSPKVQALKKQIAEATSVASEHENAVFSHLLTFFSRYYDNGDFISKRRYKGDTYAIPYAGEEVMLHWANKDQYYIKSGENFANYAFKLDDGRKVSFKLLSADTAKDNRKDNDADRRFVLIEPHTRTKLGEDGEEIEQSYQPVEVVKSTEIINGESVEAEELVIHFEYKAMKKGTKQDALVQTAIATIFSDSQVQQYWADLSKRAPTESNPSRTELERHLTTYTQRNTADYFIHKDLGGFLSNELDFYIKNEVMNLDNVQNAEVFANIEKQLRMIQCLRSAAQELIAFLAQIENFQKKLWNKKKFVANSDYFISLCHLDELAIDAVTVSQEQIKEWESVYGFSVSGKTLKEIKKENQFITINTKLLSEKERELVLHSVDNIEGRLSGEIINSDNYQALGLIANKYKSQVDCIYIDPPYNATSSEILYKNNFKHSSWLSFIDSRVQLAKKVMGENCTLIVAIDENEQERLGLLLEHHFPNHTKFCISVVHNPAGVQGTNFSSSHEYAYFVFPSSGKYIGETLREEPLVSNLRDWGGTSARNLAKTCFYPIIVEGNEIVGFGDVSDEDFHPGESNIIVDGKVHVYPVDSNGVERKWVFSRNSVEKNIDQLFVVDDGGEKVVKRKKLTRSYRTVWDSKKYYANIYGSKTITSMFGEQPFSFPKSIHTVEDSIKALVQLDKNSGVILDFFAGSGTTGHATVNINREDGGTRRFILVEQGQYCHSVTIPRVLKSFYSSSWSKGKPEKIDSLPCIVKVINVESYEDTLNNISLVKKKADLFNSMSPDVADDYLLKYMLDEESKGSLLNIENFRKPFSYEMDIATDSAGATEHKTIDLMETFNFLIGLHVKSIESNIERGFARIEGTLPSGERTLILWRDCDKIGYEKLNDYANRFDLYAKEQTYDLIYINGDHNLPTAFTIDGDDGEVVRSLKLRQIEPEFLSLMFAEEI